MKNISDEIASFLIRNTSFNGFTSNCMNILGPDGKSLKYKGVLGSFYESMDKYISLDPNQDTSITFSLDSGYTFLSSGTYLINYKTSNFKQINLEGVKHVYSVPDQTVEIYLSKPASLLY